jgi:hypothetical protein
MLWVRESGLQSADVAHRFRPACIHTEIVYGIVMSLARKSGRLQVP